MKYYSAKTVTKILGVTAQTLRNWDKENNYVFKESEKNKIKSYLDNNAFVLLKGKKDNIIEVIIVI